ncbi:MAG: hypothetical protein ACW98Y_21110 [Candidatus Thorarchaeota archaeon]|jgi:Holliday junction resolvase
MLESEMYPIIQKHMEKELGFYPVRIAPSISIREYKPDVTGIKGKKVVTIEAKISFDAKSLMEAVTQAKVYSMGSNYAYVAFPISEWNSGTKELKELCVKLCKNEGLGIYLVDVSKKILMEELEPTLSKYIDLDDYEKTVDQLEGDRDLSLYNSYPEYVRDVCIYAQNLQEPII